MMKKILSILIVFICSVQLLNAQKFHVITFFDTNDRKIGPGMVTERKITINEIQTVAGVLEGAGYDVEYHDYYGTKCGKANLTRVINGLNIGSNDIVFFYYGGHGGHAENNASDPFPQMCLGEAYETNFVPVSWVRNVVMRKNPRLAVILTGCCNNIARGITIKKLFAQSSDYTFMAPSDNTAIRKLFLETKGLVQMTSSKLGQFSWCTTAGSYFALALWEYINESAKGKVSADWKTICTNIYNEISAETFRDTDGTTYKQNPYYEIKASTGGSSVPPAPKPKPDTKPVIENTLVKALNSLLNKSVSTETRLNMINQVSSKFFAPGAMVSTIGRDMETIVDYEDAKTFLRRIAMSPYISQINIIEGNDGKNTSITVHEVRTR